MDWLDYREKLGIGFCDKEKIELFFRRLSNTLELFIDDINITVREYYRFCNETGSLIDTSLCNDYYGRERFCDCVKIISKHKSDLNEYLAYYISLVNCLEETNSDESNKQFMTTILIDSLTNTHIPYDILTDKDGIFIFPKGAKELDDALVSETLEWLKQYPQTRKEWIDALKDYSNLNSNNASDVADKFRKALERFFQEFFNTIKTLENLKSEYGNYMKSKGVPPEISNNLETLQQCYTNFMNNYAKHHDKTSEKLLEYIMYQTGNIIRLIITLK